MSDEKLGIAIIERPLRNLETLWGAPLKQLDKFFAYENSRTPGSCARLRVSQPGEAFHQIYENGIVWSLLSYPIRFWLLLKLTIVLGESSNPRGLSRDARFSAFSHVLCFGLR